MAMSAVASVWFKNGSTSSAEAPNMSQAGERRAQILGPNMLSHLSTAEKAVTRKHVGSPPRRMRPMPKICVFKEKL